jgi:hypothetical protein
VLKLKKCWETRSISVRMKNASLKKKWSLSVLLRNSIARFDWRVFEWGEDLRQRSSVGSSIRSGLNVAKRNLWNPSNHQMSLISRLNADFKIYFFSVLIALKHFFRHQNWRVLINFDDCLYNWKIKFVWFAAKHLFTLLSVVWGKMKRNATYFKFFL